MFRTWSMQRLLLLGALAALAQMPVAAVAQFSESDLQITEIFIDPPGTERFWEYFEVTSTPEEEIPSNAGGNRYYFVQIENENGAGGASQGHVDFVQQLSGAFDEAGLNYRAWAHEDETYTPATTDYTGTADTNLMENSGGTFVIVRVTTATTPPAIGHDWDSGDDGGAFDGNFNGAWVIVDSVGVVTEQPDICDDPIRPCRTIPSKQA